MKQGLSLWLMPPNYESDIQQVMYIMYCEAIHDHPTGFTIPKIEMFILTEKQTSLRGPGLAHQTLDPEVVCYNPVRGEILSLLLQSLNWLKYW